MKKVTIVFLIIGALAISAYVWVSHSLNTPGFTAKQPADTSRSTRPAESALDLRPRIIDKLQQLVSKGSHGQYRVTIHQIEPDILASTLLIKQIELLPDSAWTKDGVVKITIPELRIKGIGLQDFIDKNTIDITSIHIVNPVIELTKPSKNKKDEGTLYERLQQSLKHLSVGKIIIDKGTVVSYQKNSNKSSRFNNIQINMSDILIDSSTQHDKTRFLFAKMASISLSGYSKPAGNNLYDLKIGNINLEATKGILTARNIELRPRFSKQAFQKQISHMKEWYHFTIPLLQLKNVDWMQVMNEDQLLAGSALLESPSFEIYLDRSLPSGQIDLHSFPHQLMMRLPFKINVPKTRVSGARLSYEEFNPASSQTGKLSFNGINGTISNLTNIPEVMNTKKTAVVQASGRLMNQVPLEMTFHFNLLQVKTGGFTASLKTINGCEGSLLNQVTEPIGLFMIKRGSLQSLSSQVSGNNTQASGTVNFIYNDLHITPMEKDNKKPGALEKKNFTSLLANALVIKDQNPSKGDDPRKPSFSVQRDPHGSFFNLVWKSTFVGILKTIGAPERLAN
jgi:hypothetical protein